MPVITTNTDNKQLKNAAREKLKQMEQEAKANAAAKKAAEAQAKEDAKAAKEAEKAAAKAIEDQAKAEAKAKEQKELADKLANTPDLKPPTTPESEFQAQIAGKVSDALKAAFYADNKANMGYKMLGERFGYSVEPMIAELVAEGVWPTREKDGVQVPIGYKAVLKNEKETNRVSIGTLVNRASERFTMLNPANIAKKEAEKVEAAKRKLEDAALGAGALAKKAKGAPINPGMDVSQLSQEDLFDLAKACIMAMDANGRDLLALDPDIKDALKIED